MKKPKKSPLTKKQREAILKCVPTSWLDSLLTGPDKVLKTPAGTWGWPDIERLLGAVKARLERTLKTICDR